MFEKILLEALDDGDKKRKKSSIILIFTHALAHDVITLDWTLSMTS